MSAARPSSQPPPPTRHARLPRGWYPSRAESCAEFVRTAVAGVDREPARRGAVVPHAGWSFSGALAARTLAALPEAELVVLFGGHARRAQTPDVVTEAAWEVPGGPIPLAADLAAALLAPLGAHADEPTFADNSMEVLLPMLGILFPGARVLALRPPFAPEAEAVGRRVAGLCRERGVRALAVGSTDLTHYGPNYDFEPRGPLPGALRWVREHNDRAFIERCLARDARGAVEHALAHGSACSAGAAAAVIGFCELAASQVEPRLVGHAQSADVMPGANTVGYAGILY